MGFWILRMVWEPQAEKVAASVGPLLSSKQESHLLSPLTGLDNLGCHLAHLGL